MTKLEIIDAIEKNESVWGVSHHRMYELKVKNIEKISKSEIEYIEYNENYHLNLKINLLDMYKTKAEAEHYLHHANITRTETLPFLTWEEFLKEKYIWFVDKEQNVCCLYYLNVSNKIFINVSGEVKEIGDLTEENFYKAYDECVRLFKGKE